MTGPLFSSHLERIAENAGIDLASILDQRRSIRVWVYSQAIDEEGNLDFSGNFRALSDEINALLLSILPEFREEAEVRLTGKELEIFYYRPESDNEVAWRVLQAHAKDLPPMDDDARCDR